MVQHILALAALAAAAFAAPLANADDRVTPGEASVEPPTLISLGIDWPIAGEPLLSAKDAAGTPIGRAETFP